MDWLGFLPAILRSSKDRARPSGVVRGTRPPANYRAFVRLASTKTTSTVVAIAAAGQEHGSDCSAESSVVARAVRRPPTSRLRS